MVGRFTTTKYPNRPAFDAGRPSDVAVSYNRFTKVGLEWIWNMVTGQLRDPQAGTLTDQLASARIVVGNSSQEFAYEDERLAGDQTAQAAADEGFPLIRPVVTPDERRGVQLVLRATFGEQDAAFDWQERGVVSAQGVLIDRTVADQGRKVLGAIWQLEAALILYS
jgi:hypothetical protein